jgi:TetR/AcrR family fatty acid metabolism transcriptional regulator
VKGNKKEQIRQAAIAVIAREGFHTATTDKIAAAAGVAVGTIYNYFKNKEDILNHIFQVEYEKRAAFFARLQEQDIHPLEKIRAILTMHFAEVRENPELVRVILEEKGFSRRYYQQGPDGNKGLQAFLERIIREGIGQGKLRDCDPAMVATVLFGAIEGVMARYLFTLETGEGADLLGGAVEEITALLAQGLAAPAIRGRFSDRSTGGVL